VVVPPELPEVVAAEEEGQDDLIGVVAGLGVITRLMEAMPQQMLTVQVMITTLVMEVVHTVGTGTVTAATAATTHMQATTLTTPPHHRGVLLVDEVLHQETKYKDLEESSAEQQEVRKDMCRIEAIYTKNGMQCLTFNPGQITNISYSNCCPIVKQEDVFIFNTFKF